MKQLARDTTIYGVSNFVGKFLNWLLVPYYVRVLESTAEYGIVTNLYAWSALLLVILTYGMETTFFRFINKNKDDNPMSVYTTSLVSLLISSSLFVVLLFLFLHPLSGFLGYADYPDYVALLGVIIAIDAFCSIPFAYLRYQGKAFRFAGIKMLSVFLNIAFNLFFFIACPWLNKVAPELISWFYQPGYGVGYILVSNVIASAVVLLLLLPEIFASFGYKADFKLLRHMLGYAFPILLLGIAGIFNQTADKIIFPTLFDDREYANEQLGIYGACFKIAVIMVMFIQAFRYAYEPFIFAKNKNADNKRSYSEAMKYFIIFALLIFLVVMFYLDIIKGILVESYYPGLSVVPIVMIGEIFFGIYFNLSLWYKLTDQTRYGAWFSLVGCLLTVGIILLFAPVYGFIACAWASFASNLLMLLLSYFIGQKKYPIQYDLRSALTYLIIAAAIYAAGMLLPIENLILRMAYRTVLLALFVAYIIKKDLPLAEIPYLNRLIKKKH